MRKAVKKLAALAAAMVIFSVAGCTNGGDSNTVTTSQNSTGDTTAEQENQQAVSEYKFAMIAPLTGNNAQYGLAYKRAADLLVEQINNAGGINGVPVVIEYYDDKNDATEAVTVANNIISQPDILGCVGSQTSTPSMAIAPLFQEAKIPLVSPNASHVDFTTIGDYIFRTTYMTSASSAAIADNTYELLKDKEGGIKAGIIYMQTDWGIGFNQYFTEELEARGGNVLVSEAYVVEQTSDFTPLLTKMKQAGCNVVVLGTNYSEGAQIIKQAKNLAMDVEFVGSSMLFKQEFIDLLGSDGDGVYVMTMFNKNNSSDTFQNMKEAYIAKYGSDEDIDEYVVKAYDALKLLIEGTEAAGADREGIRDYIAAVTDWEGATNTISMDADGNPTGPVFATVIKNGAFEFIDLN